MSDRNITIVQPQVFPIAGVCLDHCGIRRYREWVAAAHPDTITESSIHDWISNSPNESPENLLVEFAGRGCYQAFGDKKSPRTNEEYLENLKGQGHLSVFYHARVTLKIVDVSRRLLQELVRHYVGCNHDIDGAISAESTRYVRHNGRMVIMPQHRTRPLELALDTAYNQYLYLLQTAEVQSMTRKERHEWAGRVLPDAAATSLTWTANLAAYDKLVRERSRSGVDLEFQYLVYLIRNTLSDMGIVAGEK